MSAPSQLPIHVAFVSVNEPLLSAPLGDDAIVLRELARRVRRISVLVVGARAGEPRSLAPNATVVPVPARSRLHGLIAIARALGRLHARDPIDVVQAQEPIYTGLSATFASRRQGSKLVVGAFGVDPADASFRAAGTGHRLGALVARPVMRRADRIQTDSRVLAERFLERGLDARYKPMTPLNLDRFLAAGERRVHDRPGRTVLFVGRLGHQKRLPLLLDAFARVRATLPDSRLVMAGDGPERAAVERRVQAPDLAGAVELLGPVAHEALPDLYLAADVLAMSSYYEGVPRAFLEAAATRMPIVSTPVAGALELAAEAHVEMSPPAASAFAEALLRMLGDAEARRHAGAALAALAARRIEETPPPLQQLAVWAELCADRSEARP